MIKKTLEELYVEISKIKLQYLSQTEVRFIEEMIPRYEKDDGQWTKSYYHIKFDETADYAPLMLDCDNHTLMDQDKYVHRVYDLVNYLEKKGFVVYVWETSQNKEFPGCHVITDEYLTWQESETLVNELDELFPDVLDVNHSKSIKGETIVFKSGDIAKDSGIRSEATRISPKTREGEETVNDMEHVYGQITTSSSLHVQLKELSYQLYCQLLIVNN